MMTKRQDRQLRAMAAMRAANARAPLEVRQSVQARREAEVIEGMAQVSYGSGMVAIGMAGPEVDALREHGRQQLQSAQRIVAELELPTNRAYTALMACTRRLRNLL